MKKSKFKNLIVLIVTVVFFVTIIPSTFAWEIRGTESKGNWTYTWGENSTGGSYPGEEICCGSYNYSHELNNNVVRFDTVMNFRNVAGDVDTHSTLFIYLPPNSPLGSERVLVHRSTNEAQYVVGDEPAMRFSENLNLYHYNFSEIRRVEVIFEYHHGMHGNYNRTHTYNVIR